MGMGKGTTDPGRVSPKRTNMNEATQKMIDGVRRAIEAEIEGHHFYRMAAMAMTDTEGKKVFEGFAEEELRHAAFLKAQYASLVEKGTVDPSVELHAEDEGEERIFSEELHRRAGEAHFEMTALSVGIQLELNAVKMYKSEAARATDPEVVTFFETLASWESSHYHRLLKEQKALRDDYWADNDFSPF